MAQDLRVKKSLAAIREGFIECVEQKAFPAITVQDICEKSMVNRSTFYKYYKDKYDLKEQILTCEVETFRVMVDIGFLDYFRSDIYKYGKEFSKALAAIKKKESIYKILWSANMEANVFQDMQTCIEEKIKIQ